MKGFSFSFLDSWKWVGGGRYLDFSCVWSFRCRSGVESRLLFVEVVFVFVCLLEKIMVKLSGKDFIL